jgi:LPXTG-motif cell wall-anchored protein
VSSTVPGSTVPGATLPATGAATNAIVVTYVAALMALGFVLIIVATRKRAT